MKRFVRAVVLPLALIACSAGVAGAFPRLSPPTPVPFRHFNTTSARGATVNVSPSDSSYATWNSSAAQPALASDTTAWFTLPRFTFPNQTLAFADSIPLLEMSLLPAVGPSTVAADSFNFVLQGSLDGYNVAMSAPAFDMLELGTSNTFGRLWNSTRLGAYNGVTATNVNMFGFPFYRVIVKDFTGTTGQFQFNERHWQDDGPDSY